MIGKVTRGERYPDYGTYFTKADNSFRVQISRLRQMASSMSTIANPEDNHRMTLRSDNNLVVFQNEKGTAECHIDNVKGRIDLDVNAEYFTELAKKLDGEQVELRYRTGTSHITLHPDKPRQIHSLKNDYPPYNNHIPPPHQTNKNHYQTQKE